MDGAVVVESSGVVARTTTTTGASSGAARTVGGILLVSSLLIFLYQLSEGASSPRSVCLAPEWAKLPSDVVFVVGSSVVAGTGTAMRSAAATIATIAAVIAVGWYISHGEKEVL